MVLNIEGKDIRFAGGYYSDRTHIEGGYYYNIVWIKQGPGIQKGKFVVDDEGVEWLIAEVYGTKLFNRTNKNLSPVKE